MIISFVNVAKKATLISVVALVIWACGGGSPDPTPDPPQSVSLSGEVRVLNGVVTDSDVNHTQTIPVANQPFTAAQIAPNPGRIGGYVNVAMAGAQGNTYESGDADDFYFADMKAGQTLSLDIAKPDESDIDLILYNLQAGLVDASMGYSAYESLVIPEDGQYYINVHAESGASNYILSIGLERPSELADHGLRLSHDFVPGEILVRFKDEYLDYVEMDASLSGFEMIKNVEASWQLKMRSDRPQASFQIDTSMHVTEEQQQKLDTLLAVKIIQKRDDVRYAGPTYIIKINAVPDDTYYDLQWHYPQINLPQAWDITTGDENVIVAVVDSGILLDHPDIQGQLVDGYDFISDPDSARDGDGADSNPNDPGDLRYITHSSFHGTKVAGLVAARTNNGMGVSGSGWRTRIMPIRVLGRGGYGIVPDIVQGIYYAAGLPNNTGTTPTQRADILNMSFSTPVDDPELKQAISLARNAGVFLVAAAGNDAYDLKHYPASYEGVISVSAVDLNSALTSYSNYGEMIDVTAPGGDCDFSDGDPPVENCVATIGGDDTTSSVSFCYLYAEGTSMSAPHVSGVIALMKAVNPNLTPVQFDDLLMAGELTTDIGNPGWDNQFGHGLIDAYKAVLAHDRDPVHLVVSPNILNFSHNRESRSLLIEQSGLGDLGAVQVLEQTVWLTVTAEQVDASGYGSYVVSVDRSSLPQGTYTAPIQINTASNLDTETVYVIMNVIDGTIPGDAGLLYVALINNNDREIEKLYLADSEGGGFSYSFNDVVAGEYIIAASSDMDNDNTILAVGEACGAYSSFSQLTPINVGSTDLTGLDFSVTYRTEDDFSENKGDMVSLERKTIGVK